MSQRYGREGDRELQRKARRFFASPDSPKRLGFGRRGHTPFALPGDAARAIAREEGRYATREFGRAIGLCS